MSRWLVVSNVLLWSGDTGCQGVCSELALVDVAGDKLRAEKMDLADGQAFMKHRIKLSADTGIT